jgi:hypothetical protein
MKLYEDSFRKIAVSNKIFENKKYYIDFEQANIDEILAEIKRSKLSGFIKWQEGNRYAILMITNFIGNIYIFQSTYDVKSQKFLPGLSGTEQFQLILNEIQEISKNIIFTYSSPSFVLRQVDYKDANPTLLLMFNYFKNIILDHEQSISLQSSLYKIINNPNFKYAMEYKADRIENIRVVDVKTIRSMTSQLKYHVNLDDSKTDLIDLPITRFISRNSPCNYFPTKALMKKKYLSFDTPENRFVKYFFQYIEGITYRLNKIDNLPLDIFEEKERVLSFCRVTLNLPFFKEICQMRMIPIHSTVLESRSGYKEVLSHFMRSRFGITHIFQNFEQESMSIDLKKISSLYEYWVFYKIAIGFLGEKIVIEQQDVALKNGDVSYGVCFNNQDETIFVYYNWTESRKRKSTYSVELRPDTTVVIKKDKINFKFVFDAKYKVRTKNNDEGIEGHVKSEDIYKMHTYLDAIENCVLAVAVYPGSEFYFYEKDIKHSIRRDVESIESFEGVGAIPLIPEDEGLDSQLNEFINAIKRKYKI